MPRVRACSQVRFRDEEFLHHAYSALEEGAGRQLAASSKEEPYCCDLFPRESAAERSAVARRTQDDGGGLRRGDLAAGPSLLKNDDVAAAAVDLRRVHPFTRTALESCITAAGKRATSAYAVSQNAS